MLAKMKNNIMFYFVCLHQMSKYILINKYNIVGTSIFSYISRYGKKTPIPFKL